MGIASLAIGILAALVCIPFFGFYTVIFALVGLILGIVDIVIKSKANQKKALGFAGIIFNSMAIVIVIIIAVVDILESNQLQSQSEKIIKELANTEESKKALSNLAQSLSNENSQQELSNMVKSIEKIISDTNR